MLEAMSRVRPPTEAGDDRLREASRDAASALGPGPASSRPGQVQAMFDRIAWVYDALNGVMSAGLHHRWRERAVDFARVGPGCPRARRRHRHRRSGARARPAGGPGWGGGGQRLLRGDARPRARQVGAHTRRRRCSGVGAVRVGRRAGVALRRTTPSTLPRSASAHATSPICARPAGDGARRAAGGQGRGAGDHLPHPSAAVAVLPRCGSTAIVPVLGRLAGDPTPTPICPTRSSASRRPRIGGRNGAGGRRRTPSAAHSRGHHHHPRRHRAGEWCRGRPTATRHARGEMVHDEYSEQHPAQAQAAEDEEAIAEIMRRGGAVLRERMVRTEEHLEQVAAEAGAPLATHATSTVLAGGKRLRPLLVVLAASAAGESREIGWPTALGDRGRPKQPCAGGGGGRVGALGDARPRRRDRRRPAAARAPLDCCPSGQARGDRDRRSAFLAGLCGACAQSIAWRSCAPSRTPARHWPKGSSCSARMPMPRKSRWSATCAVVS